MTKFRQGFHAGSSALVKHEGDFHMRFYFDWSWIVDNTGLGYVENFLVKYDTGMTSRCLVSDYHKWSSPTLHDAICTLERYTKLEHCLRCEITEGWKVASNLRFTVLIFSVCYINMGSVTCLSQWYRTFQFHAHLQISRMQIKRNYGTHHAECVCKCKHQGWRIYSGHTITRHTLKKHFSNFEVENMVRNHSVSIY